METGDRSIAKHIIERGDYKKTRDVSNMTFVGQYGGMRIYFRGTPPNGKIEFYLDISKPHDTVGKPLVNKRKDERNKED